MEPSSPQYQIDYKTVPVEYMRDAIQKYVERGWDPGSFLSAVLKNDLFGACYFADDQNKLKIWQLVKWINANLSGHAWGSVENYYTWTEHGGLYGYLQDSNEAWHD